MSIGPKKSYTVAEALEALQVDGKTFTRWVKKAGIELQPGKYDERTRRITHEQLALIAAQHERTLREVSPEQAEHPTLITLKRRIDEQEIHLHQIDHQIGALASHLGQLTLAVEQLKPQLEASTEGIDRLDQLAISVEQLTGDIERLTNQVQQLGPRPSPKSRPTLPSRPPTPVPALPTEQGQLPEGLVAWRTFAKEHGIPETTVARAVKAGRLPVVRGQWKVGRAWINEALDAEGREAFMQLYRDHPSFQQCGDPACPCHEPT